MRSFPATAAAVLLSTLATAQDNETTTATNKLAADSLLAALDSVSKAEITLSGSIKEMKEGADDGFEAQIMMIGGPGQKGSPFRGEFEVVQTETNTVVVSTDAVPGIAAITGRGDTIVRVTARPDDQVDPAPLTEDVREILAWKRLRRQVERAAEKRANQIKVNVSEDGAKTITMPLRKSFLPSDDGPMSMMSPKVMTVSAQFELNAAGNLTGMHVDVTRSDPNAALREMAMENGGRLEISGSDTELEEIEGPAVRYAFKVSSDGPSERTKTEMKSLIALVDF